MLIRLITEATSSTTWVLAGTLITGVSSTALMVMVRVTPVESRLPSLARNSTVRAPRVGDSDRLVKVTALNAAWNCASLARLPAELRVRVALAASHVPMILPMVAGLGTNSRKSLPLL